MKAKFIINPASGKQNFLKNIESIVGCLILNQVVNQIDVVYTEHQGDAEREAMIVKKGEYDFIVSVGGDGTLNDVVNGIVKGGSETPLAIVSVGTANDIVQYGEAPQSAEDFCKMIMKFDIQQISVGKINDRYFINRVFGGIGANVNDKVSQESKAVLGKLAYYMEGAIDVSRKGVPTMRIRVESPQYKGEGEVISFTVSNISVSDVHHETHSKDEGLLEVFLVKKMDIAQIPGLGIHMISRKIAKHPKIRKFRTNEVSVRSMDHKKIVVDYDGQVFGELPIELSVVPDALKLIIP